MSVKNKLCLITAGSKGIGLGVAKCFIKQGAKIAICSRSEKNLGEAKSILESYDSNVFVKKGDIGNLKFTEDLVNSVTNHFGETIDILINNNGGPPAKNVDECTEDDWQNAINRNFLSGVRLTNKVVPDMRKKKFGRIIFLTSVSGKEPDPGMVLSSTTRIATAAFSKTMSKEITGSGITFNTIFTGGVLTDRALGFLETDAKQKGVSLDEMINEVGKELPVGYIAKPDEFAKSILFLSSEDSSYINGVSLCIDGGFSHGVF